MKIVMIDDSAADRKLCRLLIQDTYGRKLEFFEESGAERGLETCRAVSPDCVLLDYRLPDMSGLEFLARLHGATGANPGIAVVMLTGIASEQVAIEAMKAGAQDYLVKDRITAEALAMAVQKATQKVSLLRDLQAERDRLARSLAEKDVLLKEIHHRVKNNLQVVASLLRLQANGLPESSAVAVLRESQRRVESMALIHEQLYESDDLRRVDLRKHASMVLSNLLHAYGVDPARISARVVFPDQECEPPLALSVDRAIPAGLILNELISNALKHAFPEGRSGSIAIEGRRHEGRILLAVHDDGIGFPTDLQPERARSLGLRIVLILTRQLKGTFEMKRAQSGSGTSFHISFPEKEKT